MSNRLAGAVWLASVLCGLCSCAAANTTAAVADVADVASSDRQLRIGLLLPLHSEALGRAAEAVQAGFMAAYERDPQSGPLTVVATGDAAQDALTGYAQAAAENDIVVGPLSRSDVTAIALSRAVTKPTIALTPPDEAAAAEGSLPRNLLVIGLSVEEEGRQIATWAGSEKAAEKSAAKSAAKSAEKALILTTSAAWQRRAGKAFAAQWRRQGFTSQNLELATSGEVFSEGSLSALSRRLQDDPPTVVFLALDASQARQISVLVDAAIPIYGTSQINPLVMNGDGSGTRLAELEGVRMVDLPWQLQPEHPAVMAYPRMVIGADQKPSADLERLYALGIDAYRIAREIGARRRSVELDGVTGRLELKFGNGPAKFHRTLLQAQYVDGIPVLLDPPR